MAFKVEFTFESLAELQEFIGTKKEQTPTAVVETLPVKTIKIAKGPKPEVKAKEEPIEEPVKSEPQIRKIPFIGNVKVEPPKKTILVNYDDVADATKEAVTAGHRPEVLELLKKYKAINEKGNPDAKVMPEENWEAYIADCRALSSEPDEEALT